MRKFNISNAERRDAEVAFEAKSTRIKTTYKTADGSATHSEKRLRSTMETEPQALLEHYADSLHEAIVAEDPEIDLEKVGLRLEGLKKVYLTDEGKVAYGDRRYSLSRLPRRPYPGRQLCPYSPSHQSRTQIPLKIWKLRKYSARQL